MLCLACHRSVATVNAIPLSAKQKTDSGRIVKESRRKLECDWNTKKEKRADLSLRSMIGSLPMGAFSTFRISATSYSFKPATAAMQPEIGQLEGR